MPDSLATPTRRVRRGASQIAAATTDAAGTGTGTGTADAAAVPADAAADAGTGAADVAAAPANAAATAEAASVRAEATTEREAMVPTSDADQGVPSRRDGRMHPAASEAEPTLGGEAVDVVEAGPGESGRAHERGPLDVAPAAEARPAAHAWPAPSSSALAAGAGEPSEVAPDAAIPASASPPTDASPAASASPSSRAPAAGPRVASDGGIPDQIAPRRPPPPVDRPPTPIVYQPVASSYIGAMRPPLPEARPRNVPAIASIVLLVLAAIGGLAVVLWLAGWDQTIAGLVSLVSVAFAAGAFFLAVGGLIVAGQRRTSRVVSAVALAVSILLAAGLVYVTTERALAILA
ncbi:hypothetical protein [Microbacterium sp. B35-04]|uniref:hypothetical protein n=1 Tax=Microbacterium sp. B35-04 TaxID=1961716 RepID=UPI001EF8272F|nr:hypothetical protein [Microbacterium sp. B35-04]